MALSEQARPRMQTGLERTSLWDRRVDLFSWRPEISPGAPLLIAIAVVVGLAVVSVMTPIAGRGDYGQWLMTSRYYQGQGVPAYRNIMALPPLIPALLGAIRWIVPDPVVALQLVNVLLLAGLAGSLYLVAAVVLGSHTAGAFSVVIGLLVTDRFLELFEFGGLLQAAAVMFMSLSVAAFVRAGRASGLELLWWILGSVSVALAAVSHVGTGVIAVPVCLATAGLGILRLRHLGLRIMVQALLPLLLLLAIVAAYWLTVLLPSSREYVTNPASLGYRGPDRLVSALFGYWPTAAVIILGGAGLLIAGVGDLVRRRHDRYLVLLLWTSMTWGALLYSALSGAATDYPRFATLLLPPLVVSAAGAVIWLAESLSAYLSALVPRSRPSISFVVVAVLMVIAATPIAMGRYERQTAIYQPRDATSLTAAVTWLDDQIGDPSVAVLTSVRDGKWLEGLTGREALFSQPVRYAFRPIEWQRSVDAEALLRSTWALVNEFYFVKFLNQVPRGAGQVPTDLLIGVNHGGEFVDVLRLQPLDTRLTQSGIITSVAALAPLAAKSAQTTGEASLQTVWSAKAHGANLNFVRRVRLLKQGSTLSMTDQSSGNALQNEFRPPLGMTFTSVQIKGHEADVCLTRIGARDPCLRIWAAQSDAVIQQTDDGGLLINTPRSGRQDVYITALTASSTAAVGLGVLDPAKLLAEHHVGAAILQSSDPAFAFRRDRLEALGFRLAQTVGPYAIMVREFAHTHALDR